MSDYEKEFMILNRKHLKIERDHIKGGKAKWLSFGIHFDWQKPHIVFYFGNWMITIGNTYWSCENN